MRFKKSVVSFSFFFPVFFLALPAAAQLTDETRAPTTEGAGIKKSLEEQVGAGRGSATSPDSSLFIIRRDPFRSIARGRQLFQRKFSLEQGLGPLTGDGAGNLDEDGSIGAGLVDSCAGCHGRPHGSAGAGGNVATRPDSRDAPHLFGLGLQEMLADEITGTLREQRDAAIDRAQMSGITVHAPLSAKGISYGELIALPDGSVDTSRVEGVDGDLRVKPFFAEGSTFSMRDFIVGAGNAEMGLEAADPDLRRASRGRRVTTPSGMVLDGQQDDIPGPPVNNPNMDGDHDGVRDELPLAVVDHLEFYLLNYFKPGTYRQTPTTTIGRQLMDSLDCTSCHIASLTIDHDRRVADVETTFDPANGVINRLFAVATPLFQEVPDGTGLPPLKQPLGGSFVVDNFFGDLKRHDLGPAFWERNFDGTIQREFMTEALWGVGSTAPYGHDGRSMTLREVILRHGGEAEASRQAFEALTDTDQEALIAFLRTLVLFPPPDTASNLNPGDPGHPDFPLRGHGSIDLSVLFNDPTDKE